MFEHLKNSDKEVYDIIEREHRRQADNLEMIASENLASFSVLEAASSFFTNKYAEGYPGKRYYGGCLYCDEIELMAMKDANAFSAPSTPMYSRFPARPRTWLFTSPFLNRGTAS